MRKKHKGKMAGIRLRRLLSGFMCVAFVTLLFPQPVLATENDNSGANSDEVRDRLDSFGGFKDYDWSYTDESGTYIYTYIDNGDGSTTYRAEWFPATGNDSFSEESESEGANTEKLIDICKDYYMDRTGVRNQIKWMNQLYATAVADFCSTLGLGDTLLIALLNHVDINTALMTSSYSMGDINRELARQIIDGADGYVDVDTIAKATGLKAKDVSSILKRIAAGTITEKTISVGKNRTRASTHGVYVNTQALKQDKVYKYLTEEVSRMTQDETSLNLLYQDLGSGYVNNMLSGQELDKYKVALYEEYLAKIMDSVMESGNPYSVADYDISKTDSYKVAKKTQSALSKLYKYEVGAYEESISEELQAFFEEHLGNGILSESEAREYLILSGEYEAGEYGIGEAAKQISKGYKYLQELESTLDTAGEVFDALEKVKKAEEFIEYWATDYAGQEILLDDLVKTLSDSGADMELMVAAKELQEQYEDKLSGTFDKVYAALIDEGIGTLKSAFPPLGITEACISIAGTLTGADDKVGALETGFAMQGICQQALEDYENAVIAVNQGDTSEEAVSKVLATFEMARQSLISYYKAMLQLSETEEEKNAYSSELKKLEEAKFGYVTVALPFGGGSGGSR